MAKATKLPEVKMPRTFEEAVSMAGYGKYNLYLLLVTGGCLMCVIIETMCAMFIIPAAQCDLNLNLSEKGILYSISFFGVVSGSHFWGFLADTRGRKNVLLFSLISSAISSFICSIVSIPWLFIVLRFINGIFIGGSSAIIYAYAGEFHDNTYRPKVVSWIATFVAFGNMYLPGLAWVVLPHSWSVAIPALDILFRPWRLLIIIYALPSLIFAVLIYFLPESPKYLLTIGKHDEVLAILKRIFCINTGKGEEEYMVSNITFNENLATGIELDKHDNLLNSMWKQTIPLFKRMYLLKTLMVCFLHFGIFLTTSAVIMWYPQILNSMTDYGKIVSRGEVTMCKSILYNSDILEDIHSKSRSSELCSDAVNTEVFIVLMVIGCGYAFCYTTIGAVINIVGKKTLLITLVTITTIAGLCAQLLSGYLFIQISIAFFLMAGSGIGIINAVVVDLYPTQIRGMALSISLMLGRFGAMAGSNIGGPLIFNACDYMFYIFTAIHIGYFKMIKVDENDPVGGYFKMIKVDENDPVGEVQLSFPYREVQIKRGVDPKDEYTLEEEIGRGKFGTVYKCNEKSSGLCLAAKFVACPKKEDRRNVEREIEIMRILQHPRLIQVYDAFENGKIMTVILELIEGGELFERVIDDDFVLTEKSCTIFMRQICEGIDFIHKQLILHLDMKPENILCLTKTGNRIKIIDFGLARKFDPSKKLQVLFGTPEFVAPEVVNFDEIGYGTDMWSVGVICYVLLSGLSPFMGHTDIETMANVTIAKYDFDDEAFDEISETAKDFIRSLLIKDMNKRLSAEECLNHDWLKKKKAVIPRTPSMDVTKDNLKQFVERWNEHPNSPYVFEISSYTKSPSLVLNGGHSLSSSSHSLVGNSPSPCGSLASSSGSDNAFLSSSSESVSENNNDSDIQPNADHFRRASDSASILKTHDIVERFNLAEEIRKLSDKLFQLSNINTSVTNIQCPFDQSPLIEKKSTPSASCTNDTNSFKNVPIKITNTPHNHAKLPLNHPESSSCELPWRRTKFKLNNLSRDVPLTMKNIHKQSHNQFTTKMNNQTASPSGTKDLLLKLLDHWDGPKCPARRNIRHGSISSEWTEDDSLGQRTISSLNSFFQSRATNKKITPFHFNKS